MKAFLTTLFGDIDTVAIVGLIVGIALLLTATNKAAYMGFAIPAVVLVGTAWLAARGAHPEARRIYPRQRY